MTSLPEADNPISPWTIPTALLLGIGGFTAYMVALFWAFREFQSMNSLPGWSPYQRLMLSTLLSTLGACAVVGPAALLVAKRRGSEGWWISIEWNGSVRSICWSVLAGALLGIGYRTALRITFGSAGSFDEHPLTLSLALYCASAVVLGPALEEMYFRGILFLAIAKRVGTLTALVIVTIAFASMHPGHRFNVAPVAIALGVARFKTKSVASCFALHASYNLFLALYQLAVPS